MRINADDFYGPLPYYDHFNQPRGPALLINNCNFIDPKENRFGSDVDVQRMDLLLRNLGYEVTRLIDLRGQQILDAVQDFTRRLGENVDYQSCIVVLMTHGHLGKFSGIDG